MYKTSKYSAATNEKIRMAILDVLVESGKAMTSTEVKNADPFNLHAASAQKISVEMNALCDYGTVKKFLGKDKRYHYQINDFKEEA